MRSSEDIRLMEEMHKVIEASDAPEEAKRLVIESEWAAEEIDEIDSVERYDRYKKLQRDIEIEAESQGIPISKMGEKNHEAVKQVSEWSMNTPAGIMWRVLGGELMEWEDAHP